MADAPAAAVDGATTATLPWRCAAIVVIFVASLLGCGTPMLLLKDHQRGYGRFKGRRCMHLMKTFSGGVVVAVGYCHVLSDARRALDTVSEYPWADVVALCGSLLTLLLSQVIHNIVGGRLQKKEQQLRAGVDREAAAATPASTTAAAADSEEQQEEGGGREELVAHVEMASITAVQQERRNVSIAADDTPLGSPFDGVDNDAHHPGREAPPLAPLHLHDKAMSEAESLVYAFCGKEPRAIAYLLEIGIVFHSVLIGVGIGLLTHDVGDVRTLTIAVAVHQYFEGAGLSTCILEARLPPPKRRVMFALFSCTTSAGIALGIATSAIYDAQSRTAAIVQGVFNALAAGTLIYLGTVDLLNEEFAKPDVAADLRLQRGMMLATVAGAAVMAALAIYA